MTYYRNRETGLVQYHPTPGLGEDFNSTEIGEDGKSVKPYTSLAPSADELRRAKALIADPTSSNIEVAASEALIEAAAEAKAKEKARLEKAAERSAAKAAAEPKTPEANTGTGDEKGGN